MTAVGITGHRSLADPAAVRAALDAALASVLAPLLGITALAAGADQLFGQAVLAAGGDLEVIVPSADYRSTMPASSRGVYDTLVDAAALTTTLEFEHAGNPAYLAAGLELLERCDLLIAVWDGLPSRGAGGTADMVRRARAQGIPVQVITAARA
jgi:hypothetical protein